MLQSIVPVKGAVSLLQSLQLIANTIPITAETRDKPASATPLRFQHTLENNGGAVVSPHDIDRQPNGMHSCGGSVFRLDYLDPGIVAAIGAHPVWGLRLLAV